MYGSNRNPSLTANSNGDTDDASNDATSSLGGGEGRNETDAHIEDAIETASGVRFQYNGVTKINPEIKFGLDFVGDCHFYHFKSPNIYTSESLHVVKTKDEFDLILWL